MSLLILPFLACSAPAALVAAPEGAPATLTVLSTNDLHGALDGALLPELAGAGQSLGGWEALAGMIARLRAADPDRTLVVDAGDCFQGPLPVNEGEGRACVRFLSLAGHAAAGLGNHEFDYKGCGPEPVGSRPADPRCALRTAIGQAPYAVVNANVRSAEGGEPGLGTRPYVVLDVGGVRVGVTGVLTPDTPRVSNPGATTGLVFGDPVQAVRSVLPRMRADGARVVIVLAHLNGECPTGAEPTADGRTPCAVSGELGTLLDAFGPGEVDLVVSGHSHAFLAGGSRRTPVMETPGAGTFVARARVALGASGNRVDVLPPVPVCRAEDPASRVCRPDWPGYAGVAPAHEGARALVAELEAQVASTCREVVATAARDVLHSRVRETPLGNLTADLLREAAAGREPPPDVVSLINLGGVRDSLRAGPITACDLHRVWPYDDEDVELTVTGEELQHIIDQLVLKLRKTPAVAGMSLRRHPDRVEIRDAAGRPLDLRAWYRLVTVHYLFRGGDGVGDAFGAVPADRVRTLPYPSHRDALKAMLKARGAVEPPALGRIDAPAD